MEKNSADIETGHYTRVDLTKIPNYEGGQDLILRRSADDDHMPYSKWDSQEQKHIIDIV
jgi:hypothetical protein